jgi:hypothetical protein
MLGRRGQHAGLVRPAVRLAAGGWVADRRGPARAGPATRPGRTTRPRRTAGSSTAGCARCGWIVAVEHCAGGTDAGRGGTQRSGAQDNPAADRGAPTAAVSRIRARRPLGTHATPSAAGSFARLSASAASAACILVLSAGRRAV